MSAREGASVGAGSPVRYIVRELITATEYGDVRDAAAASRKQIVFGL